MEQISNVYETTPPIARLQEPSSHVYDLICVGFGINSLALAVAIQENNSSSNVLFLEQNSEFSTRHVSSSSSKYMHTSFMHDLATQRDPTSEFTYLNYLQIHGHFDKFLEISDDGSPKPLRSDFCEYLSWAAGKCDDNVVFGQEVIEVSSFSSNREAVVSRDMKTGQMHVLTAKKVIYGNEKKAKVAEVSDNKRFEPREALQMLQVTDAVKRNHKERKHESSDMQFMTLCTNTVEIHNAVFEDAEPLFIRALL